MKINSFGLIIVLTIALFATSALAVDTYTEKVNKITWTYTVVNGDAWVGVGTYLSSRAVPESTTGTITIPSSLGGKPVKGIRSYAFCECTNLTSVIIPNSVTNIGWYAFDWCKTLKSITIPSGVRSIGVGAFQSCRDLTSVSVPDGITQIENRTFMGCDRLPSVIMPDSVTNIGEYAFDSCGSLTNVMMSKNIAKIGRYAFDGCYGLTAIHIKDIAGWCKVEFGNECSNPLYYAHNMYYNNSIVKDLVIPEGVMSIGRRTFDACTCITNVTISSSVTNIGMDAFRGCSGLISVSLTDIDGWFRITFVNAYSDPLYYAQNMYLNGEPVTDLRIPEGVTNIS
jgi:hypothetical protein